MNLFGKEPRPTFNNELKDKLAQEVGKEVYEWANDIDETLERCIEDARKILESHSNDNGYEIAREFEDAGYSPDRELVDILEGVGYKRMELLRAAIKAWVISDDIKPELAEGTSVTVRGADGIITGFHLDTAQYKVCIPSQGMSLDNENKRAIVNYEDVMPVETEKI